MVVRLILPICFYSFFRWIPPERYVLCMEEGASLEEVSVVVEEWLQEEEERKDGMQLIQSRLLQCKCLAKHKRIKNGKKR